jgi:hypothetical protein
MDFSTYKKMISEKSVYARIRTHTYARVPRGAHQYNSSTESFLIRLPGVPQRFTVDCLL